LFRPRGNPQLLRTPQLELELNLNISLTNNQSIRPATQSTHYNPMPKPTKLADLDLNSDACSARATRRAVAEENKEEMRRLHKIRPLSTYLGNNDGYITHATTQTYHNDQTFGDEQESKDYKSDSTFFVHRDSSSAKRSTTVRAPSSHATTSHISKRNNDPQTLEFKEKESVNQRKKKGTKSMSKISTSFIQSAVFFSSVLTLIFAWTLRSCRKSQRLL